jgi:starvation-inducible outer membrane lipoprotein
MSRVKSDQKFMNTTSYQYAKPQGKKLHIHIINEDYHKAETLTDWLFMKYNMKYSTFRSKSKAKRDELRNEYLTDTTM